MEAEEKKTSGLGKVLESSQEDVSRLLLQKSETVGSVDSGAFVRFCLEVLHIFQQSFMMLKIHIVFTRSLHTTPNLIRFRSFTFAVVTRFCGLT